MQMIRERVNFWMVRRPANFAKRFWRALDPENFSESMIMHLEADIELNKIGETICALSERSLGALSTINLQVSVFY